MLKKASLSGVNKTAFNFSMVCLILVIAVHPGLIQFHPLFLPIHRILIHFLHDNSNFSLK